jgi:hypothetical protein
MVSRDSNKLDDIIDFGITPFPHTTPRRWRFLHPYFPEIPGNDFPVRLCFFPIYQSHLQLPTLFLSLKTWCSTHSEVDLS